MSVRKILISYLQRNMKTTIFFAISSLIFLIVFHLYNLPVESVLYGFILCATMGIIFLLIDWLRYYRRHKELRDLLHSITLSIDGIPFPKDILEKDYQNLIEAIHEEKVRIISQEDSARRDMIDYYTLWVHQIKTPISAMSLMLQLEKTDRSAELSMELFKIEQYVEMVLQYLRLGSESTDLTLRNYDLEKIVKQAVRKYSKLFILKKIHLNLGEIKEWVLTDEKWLLFSIEQVLSNALKYTNRGTISIYMDHGKNLIIQDTGIGIQEEDLPRICEKGFTGYNGRSDKKSTGIGLYLCKTALSKLGHTIHIDSKIGEGTKVTIGLESVALWVE
ncbi:sensor histidine kinase [Alkaliphilus oremlandii]|uniref:histidine kinase n=1 Tax=Alkaliphilus oremlandii (strain OhILAs) TaxID=350688 RepID=A8MII7_ALKOO|nr:sensor histidine kinase [Alkaliphilus oremlandii]ABW19619.1 integral membrane sensor signal transduction histidine kinase [Alkaliphilus oremlandii OhILAs]